MPFKIHIKILNWSMILTLKCDILEKPSIFAAVQKATKL
jgi:hypothetical protein